MSFEEAYAKGVAEAKAALALRDPAECEVGASHAPMPCGCCWHTMGHLNGCPKERT